LSGARPIMHGAWELSWYSPWRPLASVVLNKAMTVKRRNPIPKRKADSTSKRSFSLVLVSRYPERKNGVMALP